MTEPSSDRRDLHSWDLGCASDIVRNDFVIPHLMQHLSQSGARSVADVGCGSGYIARIVAHEVPRRVLWQLIDADADAVDFAVRAMGEGIQVRGFRLDLTAPMSGGRPQADFAFAAFTLLEFPMTDTVASNLAGLLRPGGELAVYTPDVLGDVERADAASPGALRRYQAGHCQLRKHDKFTQRAYPFHANRLEFVIRDLAIAGLHLVGIDPLRQTSRDEDAIFCLRFARPPRSAAA